MFFLTFARQASFISTFKICESFIEKSANIRLQEMSSSLEIMVSGMYCGGKGLHQGPSREIITYNSFSEIFLLNLTWYIVWFFRLYVNRNIETFYTIPGKNYSSPSGHFQIPSRPGYRVYTALFQSKWKQNFQYHFYFWTQFLFNQLNHEIKLSKVYLNSYIW